MGPVRIRAFTRWVAEGPNALPRELIIEGTGHAGSLDEVGSKSSVKARPIANRIAFVANLRVGPSNEFNLFCDTYNHLRPHQALDDTQTTRGLPRRRTLRLACGLWRTRYLTGRS